MTLPVLDVTALVHVSSMGRGIGTYVRGLRRGLDELGVPYATWSAGAHRDGEAERSSRLISRDSRLRFAELRVRRPPFGPGDLPHFTSPFSAGAERRLRGPYVATVFDLIPALFPSHYLRRPDQRWLYRGYLSHLRGAERLVAISETVKRDACEILGYEESRVVAAPLAPTPLPAPSGKHPAGARPFLFVVGTGDPHKNVGFVIDVLASLPPVTRYRACFTGDPRHPGVVELLARAESVGVDLAHLGFVTPQELADLYASAEAVLVPSLYEGFGLPVLEALACGARRVVTSERGALPEVLGPCGLALPLDVDSWRRVLRELDDVAAPDPGVVREWLSRFTWRSTAERTVVAYAAAGGG